MDISHDNTDFGPQIPFLGFGGQFCLCHKGTLIGGGILKQTIDCKNRLNYVLAVLVVYKEDADVGFAKVLQKHKFYFFKYILVYFRKIKKIRLGTGWYRA
jgi:hypothetical protein